MTREATSRETDFPRVLGWYGGTTPGPLVICVGGMHGNEPAGVEAARQVLHELHRAQLDFRGRLIALSGNRVALAQRRRGIGEDLNRMWTEEIVAAARANDSRATNPEERELRELLAEIDAALARHRGTVVFLDLHTTSAEGAPFSVIGDTLLNRHLAMRLPAPVILGLEEHLEGTLLNYINDLGYVAVGFEGGQNESPASIASCRTALWTTLVTIGCLRSNDLPAISSFHQQLPERSQTLPRVVEIRYRHAVRAEDNFIMDPGFANFHSVRRGQRLAQDRYGEIRAQEDGLVLMPLYQSQGTDGFFLVREIRPFWLQLSVWCRRLHLERILPWLPGVRRHPRKPDTLLVDLRVARWFGVEILHLLGFRKQRPEGRYLVASRRPHDGFSFREWSHRSLMKGNRLWSANCP